MRGQTSTIDTADETKPPGLTTQFDPGAQVDTRAMPEPIVFR